MIPNNIFPSVPDYESDASRYKSMNVTRNALGSTITSPPSFVARVGKLRETNNVDDIAGAKPRRSVSSSGRAVFHDTADIDGARPKSHTFTRTGHYDVLSLDSIEGARPRCHELRTNRVVNPLDPVYKLPSAPEPAYEPPKFKRDLHQTADIEGTATTQFNRPVRENFMSVEDIDGAKPKVRNYEPTGHYDALDVQDINVGGVFVSKRTVDPLQPVYTVNGLTIRDDPPRVVPVSRRPRNEPMRSLLTTDIDGAVPITAETMKVGSLTLGARRETLDFHSTSDIAGAQSGTRRLGLKTARGTDPNERIYPLLDGRKLDADELAVGHTWYVGGTKVAEMKAMLETKQELEGASGEVEIPMAPAAKYAQKFLDSRDVELATLRAQLQVLREHNSKSNQPAVTPLTRTGVSGRSPTTESAADAFKITTERPASSSRRRSSSAAPGTPLRQGAVNTLQSSTNKSNPSGDMSTMKFSSSALSQTFKRRPDYNVGVKTSVPSVGSLQQRQIARTMAEEVSSVRALP